MSSRFDDPSQWRLKTDGGIPYKVMNMDGEADDEHLVATVSVLIQSNRLLDFMTELMPAAFQVGNISFPEVATLAGLPSLAVKSIKFKSFDDSKPIDPFLSDTGAPSGTYYPVLQIDINYDSDVKKKDTTDTDPFTFLEITGSATGEFLHTTSPKAKWKPETNVDLESGGGTDEQDGAWVDGDTLEVKEAAPRGEAAEPNKDPHIPLTITVPQTEWTARWTQIPFVLFRDVIIHRIRFLLGRVNSVRFPLLFNARPETLLFVGWQYTQRNTWREDHVDIPPITLEMKFLEKRVVWNGVVIGHNHFWRPGAGWQRLLHNGTDPVYKSWDYNRLFRK